MYWDHKRQPCVSCGSTSMDVPGPQSLSFSAVIRNSNDVSGSSQLGPPQWCDVTFPSTPPVVQAS